MKMFAKTEEPPAPKRPFSREEWQAAKEAWQARRKAALEAAPPPVHPYRIRHMAEADYWVCEKASVTVRNHVLVQGDQLCSATPRWTPAQYDADMAFEPEVIWTHIGPTIQLPGASRMSWPYDSHEWNYQNFYVGSGSSGAPANFHYGPATFSTYAEAEKWLHAYLNPVADEVFFGADGKRV